MERSRPDPEGALFGLTNTEGNHGEDVKECYFYLDATPTSSYLKALYKYPQAEFPYARLVDENHRRSRRRPEFELLDTGVFDDDRYFDVFVEYAKSSPNDILIRVTAANRGPQAATLHLLPTVWFRNTCSWACLHEGCTPEPELRQVGEGAVFCEHSTLGRVQFHARPDGDGRPPTLLFTNNETNNERLFQAANEGPYVKDAFHDYVIHGRTDMVNSAAVGTKAAAHYVLNIAAQDSTTVELRLFAEEERHERLSPRSSTARLPTAAAKRTSSIEAVARRAHRTTIAASAGRRMRGRSGRSRSTTTW